ncbi:ATP-binding protein [Vibrio sp. F74]|uniref:ATP-binding protein n=1 Tax=Vibrio sp. F74 TaxID=700020 RepID=UPI0035F54803
MRLSIFTKLFVSILLVCVVMLGTMTWFINSSFQDGLQSYLNNKEVEKIELIANKLKGYYSPIFGWQRLVSAPYLWGDILDQFGEAPPPQASQGNGPPGRRQDRPPRHTNPDTTKDTVLVPLGVRTNLLDMNNQSILGIPENLSYDSETVKQVKVEVIVDDQVVGWVSILQSKSISESLAESFFQQQSKNTFSVIALTILFSFIIAFYLVRHFLKPLKALQAGAIAIEQGDLDFQLQSKGNDELAQLTLAFNQLVQALKKQKSDREQWLSDISHELRTPIAVLQSEIEAIQDGIRKPEPQYIDSLHQQVMILGKLVNDLYELSLSDSGVNFELSDINDISAIVADVVSQNELRLKQKHMMTKLSSSLDIVPKIQGDRKALRQLFLNLMENSIRYTDQPGTISISILQEKESIKVIFQDSYPNVPEDSLPRLFDRLYRVDKSRSRASGGSGIGLSICKNIVEAHDGTITASHSELGGLKMEIQLPKRKA